MQIKEKTLEFSSSVLPAPSPYFIANGSVYLSVSGTITRDTVNVGVPTGKVWEFDVVWKVDTVVSLC